MAAKIGFIGAGKMASAMIEGLLAKGVYTKEEIIASCRSEDTKRKVSEQFGIEVFTDSDLVLSQADTLVLAVKPNMIADVLSTNTAKKITNKLVISIAAGIKISRLESYVPDCRIVRVMPNVCCMVSESASSYTMGSKTTEDDKKTVAEILGAVGMAFEIDESKIDAVTGLCGSGPAYMFMAIEAMADGGVLMGLPRELSIRLAAQTMLGSAKTVLETGIHPDQLKDSVCSPGGTTIEGVKVLEEYNTRAALMTAVQASAEKSKEMGKE